MGGHIFAADNCISAYLWCAPRIHGELLKLGIDIAQSTVAKYMSRRHGPRSPGWQTFLRNHTAHIAGVDLFVVPTIGFKLLYGLVILHLERRRLIWTDVTANPTAELDHPLTEKSARTRTDSMTTPDASAGPMVRIRFPPAASLVRTCISRSGAENLPSATARRAPKITATGEGGIDVWEEAQ